MSDNGNGKVPIKIIQLLIEKMEMGIQNSQQRINKEIEELTEAMTSVVNRINSTDKILVEKLDIVKNKVGRMILVASIVFAMLMASVALSVFGSQLLYKQNVRVLKEEIVKKNIETQEEMTGEMRKILKEVIKDCLKELKEEG